MIQALKNELLKMIEQDKIVRDELIEKNELFAGYHPKMEKIHNKNAEKLQRIIKKYGWPTKDLVGEEGSSAAWLIVQHAIGKPKFQKSCLELLKETRDKNSIALKHIAFLEDRIAFFEGRKQVYGTQFEWDESNELSPYPIQDQQLIDKLREEVGLPPLTEAIDKVRSRAAREGNTPPHNREERQREFLSWLIKVGWREKNHD